MSGEDNIHDEDENVFDEDFILDKDDAPGSKQPEDAAGGKPDEEPGQLSEQGAGSSAWEGDGDHDEEPAFDEDDHAFVLEDEPVSISANDEDDHAFVLEDEPVAVPTAAADDEDEAFVMEDEAAPAAASAAGPSGIIGSGDEDEYVLHGDLDSGRAAAAKSLGDIFSGKPQKLHTTSSHPEEGALFDEEAVAAEHQFDVGDDRQFREEGGLGWEGEDTDPETLGVSRPRSPEEASSLGDAQELLDADAAAMEIEGDPELELVEFDSELDQPANVPVFQLDDEPVESDGDSEWVLESGEDTEAADSEAEPVLVLDGREDPDPGDGWEPLDDSAALDEDGAPEPYQEYDHEQEQEAHVGPEPEPDYSEYAAQFVDQHEVAGAAAHHVVGAMEPLPRRPWRSLLAVAATILVVGLAGVAYVKPQAFLDVFGVKPEKVIVLKINRPGLDVDVTVPDVDINMDEPPVVKPPVIKPPVVEPPVVKLPVKPPVVEPVVEPPVIKAPVVKPPVLPPAPYKPVAPPVSVAPNMGVTAVQLNELDRIPFGEDRDDGYMRGGNKGAMSRTANPEGLRREFDLVMGSKALAQLMNNNIFFGRVKALDSMYVTLRFDRGEVTLPLADVRVLTHLAFDEYQSLARQGKDGFVYLRNNNRLGGLIVAQRDDSVILQVQSNRVIIPKSAIEHIQEIESKKVQFSEEDSLDKDDWVRRLVEDRLSKQPAQRIKDPGTVTVPDPGSTPQDKR